jgi:hypothetical protein
VQNIARGENGVYGHSVEIIDISVMYKMSVSVHFVSEGQIINRHSWSSCDKRKYRLFSGELENGLYDALLPVIERKILTNFLCS